MFEMISGRQRARGLVLTGLSRHRSAGARTDDRADARRERRAPGAKRRVGCGRAPEHGRDARSPHGSGRGCRTRPSPRTASARGGGRGVIAVVIVVVMLAALAFWLIAMIIETRAVPPFHKNGYVVACEPDARGGDDRSGRRSGHAAGCRARAVAERCRRILLTHAHVDHVTGVPRAKSALQVPVLSASRRSVSVRRGAATGGLSSACTATRFRLLIEYYESRRSLAFGDYEVGDSPHPGPLPWRRVSGDRQARGSRKRICSSEIRCLPARSAERICPAAITTR